MAKVRSDKGWLFLDFRHRRERSREYLNLPDTRDGRRAAENIKRQVEAELRAGTFDATRRFPNSAKLHSHGTAALTLAEFARQWMEEWGLHLKPSTRDWYRGMLTAYVFSDPLASKPIAEIGERDVYALLKDLAERPTRSGKPLSARSVNAVRAGLHTIFGVARRRKLIADDPTAYVAKLREEKPEVDPFDHEEVRALLDAAIGWERCFLAVLLFAGLRPNEAFALRWDDLDWQHGQILVRRTATRFGVGSPKTKSSNRDVPMILRLRELLAEQRQRSALRGELVFPDANGAISQSREFPSSQLGEDPSPLEGAAALALSVPAYVRALAPGGRGKGFAAGGARSRAQHRADDSPRSTDGGAPRLRSMAARFRLSMQQRAASALHLPKSAGRRGKRGRVRGTYLNPWWCAMKSKTSDGGRGFCAASQREWHSGGRAFNPRQLHQ